MKEQRGILTLRIIKFPGRLEFGIDLFPNIQEISKSGTSDEEVNTSVGGTGGCDTSSRVIFCLREYMLEKFSPLAFRVCIDSGKGNLICDSNKLKTRGSLQCL